MNRRLIAFAALLIFALLIVPNVRAQKAQFTDNGQAVTRGQLLRAYELDGSNAPEWVTTAANRSLSYLEATGYSRDSFVLSNVQEDNLAMTHIRFSQQLNGVPVFGGQMIVHLDGAGTVLETTDGLLAADVSTTPAIRAQAATQIILDKLGISGQVRQSDAYRQTTRLVVLAGVVEKPLLAYQVSVHIEDGTDATAHHEYFVDATTGEIAFYFNDLDTSDTTGTGKSLYSGQVSIHSDYTSGTYYLRDLTRGSMETLDRRNKTSSAYYFTDADNVWGNGSTSSSQSAAVDAHFGAARTWDYYLNSFGRRGIDGNGFKVRSYVHYGSRYNNAFWNGSYMTYGDGDGSTFRPLVSLDVAGHEITHGLTSKTANLTYSGESGASNESFSDIFGTMVEYSAGSGDYLIGEDIYTPNVAGDALRSMSNPGAYGDPDHYSKRYTGSSDNGGVHTNSGIQNQAFFLLAEGGTNRTSGIAVTGIGRTKAAAIFYRALTVYLTPSSNFKSVRTATLNAARDLYGSGSTEYNAVAKAWSAVGVQ